MTTQLESIVEKFRTLSIKLDELDGLTKTLKNLFDDSLMASEDCYYLHSIIRIIREKTHKTRKFAQSLRDKVHRYKLDN